LIDLLREHEESKEPLVSKYTALLKENEALRSQVSKSEERLLLLKLNSAAQEFNHCFKYPANVEAAEKIFRNA
jgi:hypothetical protein